MPTRSINFDVAVEGSVRSPRLGDPEQLSGIINGDAIIDERDEITVFIEDPLTKSAHLHISGSPITTSRFARAVGAFFQIAFREREKYGIGPEEDIGDYRIDGADRRPDGTWHLLIGV
jgi:hypothetical protein